MGRTKKKYMRGGMPKVQSSPGGPMKRGSFVRSSFKGSSSSSVKPTKERVASWPPPPPGYSKFINENPPNSGNINSYGKNLQQNLKPLNIIPGKRNKLIGQPPANTQMQNKSPWKKVQELLSKKKIVTQEPVINLQPPTVAVKTHNAASTVNFEPTKITAQQIIRANPVTTSPTATSLDEYITLAAPKINGNQYMTALPSEKKTNSGIYMNVLGSAPPVNRETKAEYVTVQGNKGTYIPLAQPPPEYMTAFESKNKSETKLEKKLGNYMNVSELQNPTASPGNYLNVSKPPLLDSKYLQILGKETQKLPAPVYAATSTSSPYENPTQFKNIDIYPPISEQYVDIAPKPPKPSPVYVDIAPKPPKPSPVYVDIAPKPPKPTQQDLVKLLLQNEKHMFGRRLRNGNSNTKNKQITQINRRIELLQQNATLSKQEKEKQNEFEKAKALARKAKGQNKTNKNKIVSNLERQLAVIRGQRRGGPNPELEIEELKKQKLKLAVTLEANTNKHTSRLKQNIKQFESIKALGNLGTKEEKEKKVALEQALKNALANADENDLKEALKKVQEIKDKYIANTQYSEPVKGQTGQNLNIRTISGKQQLVARTKKQNFTKPGANLSLINRKTGNIIKTKQEMMAEMLAGYEKDEALYGYSPVPALKAKTNSKTAYAVPVPVSSEQIYSQPQTHSQKLPNIPQNPLTQKELNNKSTNEKVRANLIENAKRNAERIAARRTKPNTPEYNKMVELLKQNFIKTRGLNSPIYNTVVRPKNTNIVTDKPNSTYQTLQAKKAQTNINPFTNPFTNPNFLKLPKEPEVSARVAGPIVTSSVKPTQNPAASKINFSELPKKEQINYIKKQITEVENWDIGTQMDSYTQAKAVEKLQKQLAALRNAVAPPILRAKSTNPPQT